MHTGRHAPYMSPAACDVGDHVTSTLSLVSCEPSDARRLFAMKFACVSSTPFAVPVEPDVYCRHATVSPVSAGACQRSATLRSTRSTAMRGRSRSTGTGANSAASCASAASVVSRQCGCASAATPSMRRSAASLRARSGSASGTAIAPA
ncbi:hypothetical protein BST28156_06561 [Burkholderia stagnalis]|nr:hypothetical protein BST28156_06561 [Burkholderia stagnalis]